MSQEAIIDLMGKGQGQGDVAQQIMANGINPSRMRPWIGADGKVYMTVHTGGDAKNPANYKKIQVNTTGTLRRDEWKALDDAVMGIAEIRLTGINDLISKGLTYNLGNGMGTTVLETTTISDALEAELTMDGVSKAKGDRQTFNTTYLPIPIIHADYEINSRVLETSRRMGNSLDVSMAERAARKVAEKLENMLFTAVNPYRFGGGLIYSYLTFPHRNLFSLTAWDGSGVTGSAIVEQVLEMKQASINDRFYGPWVLYIPTAYETILDSDYNTSGQSTQTIRERILKISGINDVKVVDTLPADNVVLVQMTSDVVRLVNGMPLTNVEWATEGNFVKKYKALAIQVPQIRADDNERCGIVHAS